jgi:hypothetical protein
VRHRVRRLLPEHDGTARTQLNTGCGNRHPGPEQRSYLLYQTYLADVNLDGELAGTTGERSR